MFVELVMCYKTLVDILFFVVLLLVFNKVNFLNEKKRKKE